MSAPAVVALVSPREAFAPAQFDHTKHPIAEERVGWHYWESRFSRHRIQISQDEAVKFIDSALYCSPRVSALLRETKACKEGEIWSEDL